MSAPGVCRASAAQLVEELFRSADQRFLTSAISQEEGIFLARLASRPEVRRTIEVGCANGISSIYICSGLQGKPDASHTAIDPFQTADFQGRGAANVARAGFSFFRLIEEFSELALPQLLCQGGRYDLAFIDGLHTADQTTLDLYYLDRLLRPGGILVIDDVCHPGVNKIVHYLSTYPNYRLVATAGRRGAPRIALNLVKSVLAVGLWPARKRLGEGLIREFFDISLTQPSNLWTLDFCTMAAFEKTSEYTRGTNWFRGI